MKPSRTTRPVAAAAVLALLAASLLAGCDKRSSPNAPESPPGTPTPSTTPSPAMPPASAASQ